MDVALRTCKLEEHKQVEIFGACPEELEMFWKSSSHHWPGTLSLNWPGTRKARPRFCILKVLGDVLDDGELHFVRGQKPLKPRDAVSKCSQRPRQVNTSFTTGKRANGY